jgi:hypothetical protein
MQYPAYAAVAAAAGVHLYQAATVAEGMAQRHVPLRVQAAVC